MKSRTVLMAVLAMAVVGISVMAIADEPAAPSPGSKAPAFTLMNQEGKEVSLSDFKGSWVVLYFYPKDFTSGCTIQAQNFQRDLTKYQERKAVILGVSVDTVDSHKDFCAKEGLNFKLLADTGRAVSGQYGSLMTYEDKQYSARNTFLIDPSGVIRKTYLKVKPMGHSAEVLADLDALQAAK